MSRSQLMKRQGTRPARVTRRNLRRPISASMLCRCFESAPEKPGVYLVYLRQGVRIENREYQLPNNADGPTLIYIGSTVGSLRSRLKQHLLGDSRGSTLRGSVGILLRHQLQLQSFPDSLKFHFGEGESRLTEWLKQYTLISYRQSRNPKPLERALIEELAPAFNIALRRTNILSCHLMNLRARYRFAPNPRSPEYRSFVRYRSELMKPRLRTSWLTNRFRREVSQKAWSRRSRASISCYRTSRAPFGVSATKSALNGRFCKV